MSQYSEVTISISDEFPILGKLLGFNELVYIKNGVYYTSDFMSMFATAESPSTFKSKNTHHISGIFKFGKLKEFSSIGVNEVFLLPNGKVRVEAPFEFEDMIPKETVEKIYVDKLMKYDKAMTSIIEIINDQTVPQVWKDGRGNPHQIVTISVESTEFVNFLKALGAGSFPIQLTMGEKLGNGTPLIGSSPYRKKVVYRKINIDIPIELTFGANVTEQLMSLITGAACIISFVQDAYIIVANPSDGITAMLARLITPEGVSQ